MAAKTIEPGNPVKQFSVLLPNRAGALASLVKLLRSSAIEVVGISVQDSRDATIARLEGYTHMADFGTCAVDWPLLDQWEDELARGLLPS